MRHNHMHTRHFIVGAAVGSLLGSVTALLVAPSSGKKFRRDICDTYCSLSERTNDLADKGRSFARSLGSQTNQWASKAKSAVNGAKKSMERWISKEEEEDHCTRDFLVGGLAGGILGAVGGLILAPKSGEEFREDIVDTYEDFSDTAQEFANNMSKKGKVMIKSTRHKANKWLDLAKQVVDDLSEEAQDRTEDLFEKAKSLVNNRRVHDVLDWASLGARIWQGIKSKR